MNIYCIKCKNKTNTLNIERSTDNKNRNIIKGICEICNSKKSQYEKIHIISNEDKLNHIYYNTKTGYSGINDIARKSEENVKSVKTYLESKNVYTLHKPVRKKFERRKIFVYRIDEQWQADLVDMQLYSKENEGYNYMLTVIDCFSRFAFAKIIKNKSGDEVKNAFESIFNERIPKKIQADQGTEFYNVQVKKLFDERNIIHFSVYSDVKACMVERFNRTLKSKMWKVFTERKNHKYIDILDDLVNNYNNSFHNTIKMTPVEASKKENTLRIR